MVNLKLMYIGDGQEGLQYVSPYGKVVQLEKKGTKKCMVKVLMTGRVIEIDSDYQMYLKEDVDKSADVESKIADVPEVPNILEPARQYSAEDKEVTQKLLVWEKLKEGPQTRESLAKFIIDSKLSKNTNMKKVKSYVSVILSMLKKKHNVNIVSVKPGTYEIQ